MLCYCSQCGYISGTQNGQCPACDELLLPVPPKYLTAGGNMFLSQESKEIFVKDVIENGEKFDSTLADKREAILLEKRHCRQAAVQNMVKDYKSSLPIRKCPVCASQNIDKISNVGKVAKIAVIGVWGAGDLGKQWRCNSCGHKF